MDETRVERQQSTANVERPASINEPSRLPNANGRLVLMGVFALVAVFLSVKPDPSEIDTEAELLAAFRAAAVTDESSVAPVDSVAPTTAPVAIASVESDTVPPSTVAVVVEDELREDDTAAEEPVEAAAESEPEPEPEADDGSSETGGVDGDDFEQDSGLWDPMTGDWKVEDGKLVQANSEGFDFINIYTEDVPDEFSVSVTMQAISEELGGGLVLRRPNPGSRRGAYVVDFTSGGSFLRWGRYDEESGEYTYIGGLNAGVEAADAQTLMIESKADTTLVYLNDTYIGAFEAMEPSGLIGVVASQSSIEFDDFVIGEL